MRIYAPICLSLFAACTGPSFVAKTVVDLTVPVTDLADFTCESHNGGITVTGDGSATKVEVHAELSVYGYTQAEADANLRLLSVGQDSGAHTLHIFGKYPEGSLNNMSPSFSFTVKVPPNVAVSLVSHNGSLHTAGTSGNLHLESHNGSINAAASSSRVLVLAHNGNIGVTLATAGPVDGNIESHNGGIEVEFGPQSSATVKAATHNGRVEAGERLVATEKSRTAVQGRIGDGKGDLTVTSHNGNVVVR